MTENSFFIQKVFVQKSHLTINIFMLENLVPILVFVSEIKSIQSYLHGHMIAAMCFTMGHLVK